MIFPGISSSRAKPQQLKWGPHLVLESTLLPIYKDSCISSPALRLASQPRGSTKRAVRFALLA